MLAASPVAATSGTPSKKGVAPPPPPAPPPGVPSYRTNVSSASISVFFGNPIVIGTYTVLRPASNRYEPAGDVSAIPDEKLSEVDEHASLTCRGDGEGP
jgi:hypothetical protein